VLGFEQEFALEDAFWVSRFKPACTCSNAHLSGIPSFTIVAMNYVTTLERYGDNVRALAMDGGEMLSADPTVTMQRLEVDASDVPFVLNILDEARSVYVVAVVVVALSASRAVFLLLEVW
jgi:hypothetical protein